MPNNTLEKWDEKTLGELCDVLDSRRKPITKKDRVAGVYPYYGATGILDYVSGWIFDEELVLLGEDGAKWTSGEQSAFKINGKTWVNNHAHVLRPKRDRISDTYLIYNLNFQNLMSYITGTTVPKLNQEKMRSITIPLPPLPEQERIVAKLDKAFEAIDKVKANAEQNLNNTQELFESALNKSFTENTKGWEEKNLKNVSNSIQYGYTESANYKKVGPKFLRITDIQDNNVSWVDVPYCVIDDDNRKKYVLKNGDIVFARTGATVGKSYLIENLEEDAVYASYLIRVSINRDLLIPKFVKHFFESKLYWNQIIDKQTGAGQPNVNGTKLGQIVLSYPKIEEQQKIVEKLDALQEQTKRLEQIYTQKIKECDELKQSILQKAFRGEL